MKELGKMDQINDLAFDLMHKEMNPTEQFVYADKIYQLSLQPEFNENQQVVFEWLKHWHDGDPYFTLSELYDSVEPGEYKYEHELDIAYEKLSEKERFQVLAAFAEWGKKEVAE